MTQATANAQGYAVGYGGVSGSVLKKAVIDLGSLPVYEATVTITDASVSSSSIITVQMNATTPTKDADEVSMDSFDLYPSPGTGNFSLYIRGLEGYIADKFTINYAVG